MTAYKCSAKAAHTDKGGSAASMHILETARRACSWYQRSDES